MPACKAALEHAKLTINDIDAIVFATLSSDYTFPGSGCVPERQARHERQGARSTCETSAPVSSTGSPSRDGWIQTGLFAIVLVVGAEVHSTGIDFTDRGRDVAVLFGDGAGAVVVGPAKKDSQGLLSMCLHADGTGVKDLWCEAPASCYDPRITHAMIDEGRHYPKMVGKQVFRWAIEKMPEVAIEAVRKAGLTMRDIDLLRAASGEHAHQPDGRARGSSSPTRRSSTTSRSTATRPPRRSRWRWTKRTRKAA